MKPRKRRGLERRGKKFKTPKKRMVVRLKAFSANVEKRMGEIAFKESLRDIPYSRDLVLEALHSRKRYGEWLSGAMKNELMGLMKQKKKPLTEEIITGTAINILKGLTRKHVFYGKALIPKIDLVKIKTNIKITAPFLVRTGIQTRVTPLVKKFATGFPRRNRKTVQRMVNFIHENFRLIKPPQVKFNEMKEVYGKRTAAQIISSKTYAGKGFGCNDMCVALISALKAKGIPCKFIRTTGTAWYRGEIKPATRRAHSLVMLKLEGRILIADPFATEAKDRLNLVLPEKEIPAFHKQYPFTELEPFRLERVETMKKRGLWFEGRDAWEMGINKYDDLKFNFWKEKLKLS